MRIVYPHGKKKALTFSFDDGQIHDRRLIDMMNRHGLKGTFHLNSGRLTVGPYLPAEEVPSLYKGHEIACHGVEHKFLDQLSDAELVHEIWEDRRSLETLSGSIVTGLSYAFGVYTDHVIDAVRLLGIEYSRTVEDTGRFTIPSDFMRWHPTCHFHRAISDDAFVDSFLNPPEWMKPELFYIWGHSYEFEQENSWDQMERLCERLSGHDDIWYTTNLEFCRYRRTVQSLVWDTEMKRVCNPGAPVWVEEDDGSVHTV